MRADADLVGVVFGRWESKVKCVAAWKLSDCGDSWVASAALRAIFCSQQLTSSPPVSRGGEGRRVMNGMP